MGSAVTAARFNQPAGLAVSGNLLYIVDRGNHVIKVMNLDDQIVSFLVGSTAGVPGYVNGAGDAARFLYPTFMLATGDTLYVSDSNNHAIRVVDISVTPAAVTTFAGEEPTGNAGQSGYVDATGAAARFDRPAGLALQGTTLYIADMKNRRVRAVDTLTRAVTTVAGDGTSATLNGPGASAQFKAPFGLAVNGATLYVSSGDSVIRTIDLTSADKTVGTLCGNAGTSGSQDGDCASTATTLGATYGMAIAGSVLYFADYGVDKIRAIDVDTNQVSTFSGSGTQGYSLGATTLQDNYHAPMYVAVLGDSLLATENIYHTIRAIEYQLTSSPTSARGDAMVDLSPDLDYNDNTGTFAISFSGSVVASFEACKELCTDDPACAVIHYCDSGSGTRAGECWAAALKLDTPAQSSVCSDAKNAERVPVCPAQPGETLLWTTTSIDASLCTDTSTGGRVEYTGQLCGACDQSLCDIDWTYASTIDIRAGSSLSQSSCQWNWTTYLGDRERYAGACGVAASTPVIKNRLPVQCYSGPSPTSAAPTPAPTLAPTPAPDTGPRHMPRPRRLRRPRHMVRHLPRLRPRHPPRPLPRLLHLRRHRHMRRHLPRPQHLRRPRPLPRPKHLRSHRHMRRQLPRPKHLRRRPRHMPRPRHLRMPRHPPRPLQLRPPRQFLRSRQVRDIGACLAETCCRSRVLAHTDYPVAGGNYVYHVVYILVL